MLDCHEKSCKFKQITFMGYLVDKYIILLRLGSLKNI